MAVTIKNADPIEVGTLRLSSGTEVKVSDFEVFGRMRLTYKQIANYYGLAHHHIYTLMTKSVIRTAYEKGRAETTLAIRQKQLQMALAGNVTMLLHAGLHFADQDKDGPQEEPEDFEPTRFSWNAEMKKQLVLARERIEKGAGESNAGTNE